MLLAAAAAGAAGPDGKTGGVTVLDEACVERRTEMCLRLADAGRSTAVESDYEKLCSSLVCPRGWHRTELGRYGALGPLCICERRQIVLAQGQRCAEGFREAAAPDGRAGGACELPELTMEQYPGAWQWPSTPWDLMTCLQFARSGPGSGACRKSIPAAAR